MNERGVQKTQFQIEFSSLDMQLSMTRILEAFIYQPAQLYNDILGNRVIKSKRIIIEGLYKLTELGFIHKDLARTIPLESKSSYLNILTYKGQKMLDIKSKMDTVYPGLFSLIFKTKTTDILFSLISNGPQSVCKLFNSIVNNN
jgi:hypothetical protein